MARILVLPFLVWMFLDSALAISTVEISALRDIGSRLGVQSRLWNFDTDPCSGRWIGISCCDIQELNSTCCSSVFDGFSMTSCSTASTDTTVVGLFLDSNFIPRVLSGPLSDAVCNLTSLVTLDLNNNFLTGTIPRCIGTQLPQLKKLGLSGGNLGAIPEELGSLSNLEELYLDGGNLTGSIPSSFGGMRSLQVLSIKYNQLTGRVPQELGRLANLEQLGLEVNNLEGDINFISTLTRLTSLTAFNNRFSGSLSISAFQNLSSLQTVNLRQNGFNGSIPEFDQRFVNLTRLDLGFNQFSGSIPSSLSRIRSLNYLFLGHNHLSGTIPPTSATLAVLDISHNSLTGPLRNFPQQLDVDFSFNSLDSVRSSAGENAQGFFQCITESSACNRSLPGADIAFAVRAGGSGNLQNKDGTLFRGDQSSNTTGLHYFEADSNWALELSGEFGDVMSLPGNINALPAEDDRSLYATTRWSSSYLAYHGSGMAPGNYSVTMYFCEPLFRNVSFRAMDVVLQGEVIARKLDVVQVVGPQTAYKIARTATVIDGRLSIEFISTGPDRYLDPSRFRLAQHSGAMVSAISVRSLDYVDTPGGSSAWIQRRKIAIDTAFGLAYLHDESKHRIIHCDLKPPNILLDEDLTPRIADFGMARLYEEGRSHVTATKMGGTIGYLAPEYAMHYHLSDKADVYSYGVVLLEILSGRRPVDSAAPQEQVVLVDFAHSLASIGEMELAKLVDEKLEGEFDEREAVDMARIAVLCTLENPSLRPGIRSVWLMLKGAMEIPDIPAMLDTRYNAVRALMIAYEQQQQNSQNGGFFPPSPR